MMTNEQFNITDKIWIKNVVLNIISLIVIKKRKCYNIK